MSRELATTGAVSGFALALVVSLAACSGASDDTSSKKDVAPNEPASSSGSSGSSGKTTSGAPGSSGSSGSSGMTSGSSGSSGGTDAGSDGPATNCVPMGYAGNAKKIGAYCDKDVSCPFQVDPFLVCTYGHDPTNTHLFCTAPCSKDSECGAGAYCMHDPKGNGCVPTQCGGMPGM